jgi:DNA sulfur modification protein DndE
MKPPIDYVRISAKNKDILLRLKKRTGIDHWNELCRVAVCHSLANTVPPPSVTAKSVEVGIDMEWKTFAGPFHQELSALITFRAMKDDIDPRNKEMLADYFRGHLERGIASFQQVSNLRELAQTKVGD